MTELEKLEQARDLINELIAGRQTQSVPNPVSAAKSQPQGQQRQGNKLSADFRRAKILTATGLAEQEAEKLGAAAVGRKLGEISAEAQSETPDYRKMSDSITTALGEADLLRENGVDTSELVKQLNTINESIGSGGATIGGTDVDVTKDMEGTVK